MGELPPEPRTEEEAALARAREHVPAPELLTRHPHPAYDADEVSGGHAFTTPDRLVLVGRRGNLSVELVGPDDDIDRLIGARLAEQRHRDRPLSDADLGPCQQAALRVVDEGVAPAAVTDRLRHELATQDQVEAATYLWMRMRRAVARGGDARRELAANDDLLAGTGMPPALMVIACPVCGLPALTMPRHPRAVCDDCFDRVTCVHGRRVHGFNTTLSGGFAAEHLDGEAPRACEETTRSGECRIGDVECRIGEARFGGVVVEAVESD